MLNESRKREITGHCYCGAISFESDQPPLDVIYCHCGDCRRVSGAPVAAYAAFDVSSVSFAPNEGRCVSVNPGAQRYFCDACGSQLASCYDYLPDKIYLALGVIDQAAKLTPTCHAHNQNRLPWLYIDDNLKCFGRSARAYLNDDESKD